MPERDSAPRSLAAIFKALSDETRLEMLGLLLAEGELCVCDVMEVLGITQSKASRHLRRLVDAGLLEDRREAVWVHFQIARSPGPVQAAVLGTLRGLLPGHVPARLFEQLAAWRERKGAGGASCGRGSPAAMRRARSTKLAAERGAR